MNFFLSLTLYNPLESFVIIYALHVLENKRLEFKNNIKHFYFLGTINLLFQYILHFLKYTSIGYYINTIFPIFIAPIILYFYFYMFSYKFKYINCFIIQVVYIFTLMFSLSIINYFFDGIYKTEFYCIIIEFLGNISIRTIQLIIIKFFVFFKENGKYEKIFKKNC